MPKAEPMTPAEPPARQTGLMPAGWARLGELLPVAMEPPPASRGRVVTSYALLSGVPVGRVIDITG